MFSLIKIYNHVERIINPLLIIKERKGRSLHERIRENDATMKISWASARFSLILFLSLSLSLFLLRFESLTFNVKRFDIFRCFMILSHF